MTLSAFEEKARRPTDDQLRATLGRAYAPWIKLLTLVAQRIDSSATVWKFSTGWSLRVLHKDRVIVYLIPQQNQFLVSFALGEKAVAAAHAAKLSAAVLRIIDDAPRYAEGRGVRIPVRGSRQLTALARLAQIKREN
jgi:Protein of unknown function (DUF3788)